MKDPRLTKLAKVLINYSCKLQKGEKVLIEGFDVPPQIIIELVREARIADGIPFATIKQNEIQREIIREGREEQLKEIGDYELYRMKKVQAYIGVRGALNSSELVDVPSEKMKLYQTHWLKPVHLDQRVRFTKWVVLRYPTHSMAQQAGMSTEEFENFYFDVCTLDYEKLSKAMNPLKELMEKTDKVHIKGNGTDLTFSIKGLPAVKCDGERNIPDGELYTAPVKNSVNGYITFNTPSMYQGTTYENIYFEFKDGKIVKAKSSNTEKMNKILDSDEGARYIGEFSLGFNPYIIKPIKDTLFDEKIMGSFHLTPGNAYDECNNGNKSEIHWDIIMIQTKEYGGGEIWFDDVLVRKDGRFVLRELEALNPENLK